MWLFFSLVATAAGVIVHELLRQVGRKFLLHLRIETKWSDNTVGDEAHNIQNGIAVVLAEKSHEPTRQLRVVEWY